MKTMIVICGPTAVGKTDTAIAVAQHFHTSIISADSRQCYRELNIGVAKPDMAQLSAVHHYFINTHDITDHISAADFEKYALNAAEEIFAKSEYAVMCGGTGLYIKAFSEGLDAIPEIPEEIDNEVNSIYNLHGIAGLQEIIEKEDPIFFAKGEIKNPHRAMRALAVKRATGFSIIDLQKGEKKTRPFQIIKICLDRDRDKLYDRINTRVDEMISAGLESEALELFTQRELNALQTVGYRELFDFFSGTINREKVIELIKRNTRHYAKRQMTWFNRQADMHHIKAGENAMSEIINLVSP